MTDDSLVPLRTTVIHGWVDRLRAGDPTAADELVRHAAAQLETMARKTLRRFPSVGRWEQTGDVLQNAIMRLLRALERDVRPVSVRAFFGLAATQIRRELLDLARHYQGPRGVGANHASVARTPDSDDAPATPEPVAPADDLLDLERWAAFHAAVERLPAPEREVMGLAFYHGCTHKEIAHVLDVTERTVRRHWRSACRHLSEALGGNLPEMSDLCDTKGALS
jgi:RNA polymerase sigma-70 factor (ECF subfamily)